MDCNSSTNLPSTRVWNPTAILRAHCKYYFIFAWSDVRTTRLRTGPCIWSNGIKLDFTDLWGVRRICRDGRFAIWTAGYTNKNILFFKFEFKSCYVENSVYTKSSRPVADGKTSTITTAANNTSVLSTIFGHRLIVSQWYWFLPCFLKRRVRPTVDRRRPHTRVRAITWPTCLYNIICNLLLAVLSVLLKIPFLTLKNNNNFYGIICVLRRVRNLN